jgi:branched-chain amino acid transport system substrate-binding protein
MRLTRTIFTCLSAAYLVLESGLAIAGGQYGPGVSDAEIKIGNTTFYSGPASSYGA